MATKPLPQIKINGITSDQLSALGICIIDAARQMPPDTVVSNFEVRTEVRTDRWRTSEVIVSLNANGRLIETNSFYETPGYKP